MRSHSRCNGGGNGGWGSPKMGPRRWRPMMEKPGLAVLFEHGGVGLAAQKLKLSVTVCSSLSCKTLTLSLPSAIQVPSNPHGVDEGQVSVCLRRILLIAATRIQGPRDHVDAGGSTGDCRPYRYSQLQNELQSLVQEQLAAGVI